jgi:antitoxin (DNA-binding transcriptional repressor) of toxin-antitoxin stability system
MSMVTLTPTNARANLSALLRRALRGDDIGIVVDGQIVALRPVKVEATDYAMREYGVTEAELAEFETKIHEKIAQARKEGTFHEYTGDIEAVVAGKARR